MANFPFMLMKGNGLCTRVLLMLIYIETNNFAAIWVSGLENFLSLSQNGSCIVDDIFKYSFFNEKLSYFKLNLIEICF